MNIKKMKHEKRCKELFEDNKLVERIKQKLPYFFQIAELESSRAGKIGMEVGSVRERIIVALLIYKFGEANLETEIPITQPEEDVKLFGEPLSIKTITGKSFSGVKLIWTVDAQKAYEFRNNYCPSCDMMLVQINWEDQGGLFYIPVSVQKNHFKDLGRENYIKLPKPGTNPRGVEISKEALSELVNDKKTYKIKIHWQKKERNYNPLKRWVDLWTED